jgi:hypothetical protein
MVYVKKFLGGIAAVGRPGPAGDDDGFLIALVTLLFVSFFLYLAFGEMAFAAPSKLPGEDASDKLQAAGTLLRIIDTGLFQWGARIFAGICIMSAGWALKEQRFGIAIISVIGAIIFGTAPTWVKNIFDIGGGGGVFSSVESSSVHELASRVGNIAGEATRRA